MKPITVKKISVLPWFWMYICLLQAFTYKQWIEKTVNYDCISGCDCSIKRSSLVKL